MSTAVASTGATRNPSAAECNAMARDGYLIVRNFFSSDDVVRFLAWTSALQAAPERPGAHWVYREDSLTEPGARVIQRIENFCPFHSGFDRMVRDGALSHWLGTLLGTAIVLFKDKINFKMPGGGEFKAHQDQQAGWSRYAPEFVTAMVTLDSATLDNGCLEIAPRRRGDGLLGAEWIPLEESALSLTPEPTAPGDVIFFDSFVPHASKANLTGAPRRILYLTYNAAGYGDLRSRYFEDKHAAFPPDIERERGKHYVFRV